MLANLEMNDLGIKLEETLKKICNIYEEDKHQDINKITYTNYEFNKNFYKSLSVHEFKNIREILSKESFKKEIHELNEFIELKKIIKFNYNKIEKINEYLWNFIIIYFEDIGYFKFEKDIFSKLFMEFSSMILDGKNSYFIPLFRLKLDSDSRVCIGPFVLEKNNQTDFRLIKNELVGKNSKIPGYLHSMTHVLHLYLDKKPNISDAQLEPDSKQVDLKDFQLPKNGNSETTDEEDTIPSDYFEKFMIALSIFAPNDVTKGNMFKNFYNFDPNISVRYDDVTILPHSNDIKYESINIDEFKKFYSKFQNIDFKEKHLDFLFLALRNFSYSKHKTDTTDRWLELFIVQECLFSSKGETTFKLLYRQLLFNGNSESEYSNLYEFLSVLKDFRNDVVHGRDHKIPESADLSRFENMLRVSLLNFIDLYVYNKKNQNLWSKNKDFRDYIMKYLDDGLINREKLDVLKKIINEKN